MKKKLRIWPSDEQIGRLDTKRLLNILKIVRAKNGALFNLGDGHFLKEEDLVVGTDDKLIEKIARHRSMILKLKAELSTRGHVE